MVYGPLRQYFSLYWVISQKEGECGEKGQTRVKKSKQPPPAPTASTIGPCPTVIHIVGRPGTGSLPSTVAPPDHPLLARSIVPDYNAPRKQTASSDNHDRYYTYISGTMVFKFWPSKTTAILVTIFPFQTQWENSFYAISFCPVVIKPSCTWTLSVTFL